MGTQAKILFLLENGLSKGNDTHRIMIVNILPTDTRPITGVGSRGHNFSLCKLSCYI